MITALLSDADGSLTLKESLLHSFATIGQLDEFEMLNKAGALIEQIRRADTKVQEFQTSLSKSDHVLSLAFKVDPAAETRFLTAVKDRGSVEEKRAIIVPPTPQLQIDSLILTDAAHKASLLRFMQELPVSLVMS